MTFRVISPFIRLFAQSVHLLIFWVSRELYTVLTIAAIGLASQSDYLLVVPLAPARTVWLPTATRHLHTVMIYLEIALM